jgi:hypothetical protein
MQVLFPALKSRVQRSCRLGSSASNSRSAAMVRDVTHRLMFNVVPKLQRLELLRQLVPKHKGSSIDLT